MAAALTPSGRRAGSRYPPDVREPATLTAWSSCYLVGTPRG